MIELLIASGSIVRVVVVPIGGEIKRGVRKPELAVLQLLKKDIVRTMPVALMLGLASTRPVYRGMSLA